MIIWKDDFIDSIIHVFTTNSDSHNNIDSCVSHFFKYYSIYYAIYVLCHPQLSFSHKESNLQKDYTTCSPFYGRYV